MLCMTSGGRDAPGPGRLAGRRTGEDGLDADEPVAPGGEESAASLGQQTRRGLRLSVVAQTVVQLGSVAATVVLARLLTPGEFGIVALGQSLLGVTALVSLVGINAALITRRGDVQVVASTFFWLALMMGVAVVALATVTAGPLTGALGLRTAAPYLAVLSLSFALDLVGLVPGALLQRSRSFGWLNGAQVAGASVYFVGEVVLALLGNGAWSVVIAQVAGSATTSALALRGARWLPGRHLALRESLSDLRLTAEVGVGQLLSYLQKNVDYWAVSRVLGGGALGVYYVAYVVPNILRLRLSTAVRQVLIPTFASLSTVTDAADVWRRTLPLTMGVGLPALTGLAAVADLVIRVFFGSRWDAAVDPMRVLTLGTVADLLMTSVAALAIGRRLMRPYLVVLGARAVATAALAVPVAVMTHSNLAVAWAVTIAAGVGLVAQELVLSPLLGAGLRQVAKPLAGYAALSGAMGAMVLVAGHYLPMVLPPIVRLGILGLGGAIGYVLLGRLLAPRLLRPVLAESRRLVLGR